MKNKRAPRRAAWKAALLVSFALLSVLVWRGTPARDWLTSENLSSLLAAAGIWGPLVFILFFGLGICLFIPGTVLTTLGAVLFGPYLGFLYNWLGAMAGASAAFFIARYLGRDFAAALIGDRLQKYDEGIERHGFATVLYLRLICFPFTLLDFGMGLTRVRFWDYFWGTALGILVGTFVITFLVGTLKEAWVSGQWNRLWGWETLVAAVLLVFSLFIPALLKKVNFSRILKIF